MVGEEARGDVAAVRQAESLEEIGHAEIRLRDSNWPKGISKTVDFEHFPRK